MIYFSMLQEFLLKIFKSFPNTAVGRAQTAQRKKQLPNQTKTKRAKDYIVSGKAKLKPIVSYYGIYLLIKTN